MISIYIYPATSYYYLGKQTHSPVNVAFGHTQTRKVHVHPTEKAMTQSRKTTTPNCLQIQQYSERMNS